MPQPQFDELMKLFSLDAKVAVITGAASGLGREAARVFAIAGARVLLVDINQKGLEATAAIVRELGGHADILPADVADRAAVEAVAERAASEFGGLDIWINAAGIPLWAEVIEGSQADVERIVSINLMGTYWGCAAAGRVMKRLGKGGAIVNVSSTAGETAVPSLGVYGMTKAGVNQLTSACAKEFGAFDVRVNCVVPGWIDTPINASMYREPSGEIDLAKRGEVMDRVAQMSPLGMTGKPLDIGMGLLYLASAASSFVTGHLLRISGGV
jgi:3-oxoacyl-[acyl-carrier protein] reductase